MEGSSGDTPGRAGTGQAVSKLRRLWIVNLLAAGVGTASVIAGTLVLCNLLFGRGEPGAMQMTLGAVAWALVFVVAPACFLTGFICAIIDLRRNGLRLAPGMALLANASGVALSVAILWGPVGG